MKLGTLVTWSFFISLATSLLGALMNILHLPGADQLLITGIVSNGVFVVTSLYEIWNSLRIISHVHAKYTVGATVYRFYSFDCNFIY